MLTSDHGISSRVLKTRCASPLARRRTSPAPQRGARCGYCTAIGFTLIELLLVLVIAGIAVAAIVPQLMPDDRGQLRAEADRLALLMENAQLEARSSGVSMAWLPDSKGYQFWRRSEQGSWKPLDEGPFRFRPWNEQTRIAAVLIDDDPLKFGERMLLSATSFSPPYEIRLVHGTARATIRSGGSAVSVQMEELPDDARAAR